MRNMRLIDAHALKRKAQKVATESWKMRVTARIETVLNQFIDWIDNVPSIQPEPRTAYWTKDIVGSVVCSYCGGIREDNRIGHTQWCNCCGAKMRGEQDANNF